MNQKIKTQFLCVAIAGTLLVPTSACRKNNQPEQANDTNVSDKVSAKTSATIPTLTTFFKSNFETGVNIVQSGQVGDLTGGDISPYNWVTTLEQSYTYFNRFRLNYEEGTFPTDRAAELVANPLGSGRTLRFQITNAKIPATNPTKARIQADLDDLTAPGARIREYSQKVKMLFDYNGFIKLANSTYPTQAQWLTLFEFWDDEGTNNQFRISVNLARKTEYTVDDGKLYWEVSAQEKKNSDIDFVSSTWGRKINKTIPIPLNQWITVEIYLKQDKTSAGKFIMNVNGQTVFDLPGRTVSSVNTAPNGMEAWNPMKMYCSKTVLDVFKSGNNPVPMKIYWDDIELRYRQ